MGPREPVFHPTPILTLRPTQITLGFEEVNAKRNMWKTKTAEQLSSFLQSHLVPTILGPNREPYLIDHHHLARALHDEGVQEVFVTTVADLSRLTEPLFWNVMDMHGWTHPYDGKGRRRAYSDLPKTIKGMEDDPYRSLAGELRSLGGFAKDSTPYSEFLWADFLALADQGQGDQGRLQGGARRGADACQDRRRRLPPRLVRTARLCRRSLARRGPGRQPKSTKKAKKTKRQRQAAAGGRGGRWPGSELPTRRTMPIAIRSA